MNISRGGHRSAEILFVTLQPKSERTKSYFTAASKLAWFTHFFIRRKSIPRLRNSYTSTEGQFPFRLYAFRTDLSGDTIPASSNVLSSFQFSVVSIAFSVVSIALLTLSFDFVTAVRFS
jgi:hypothetical protein